MLSFVAAIDDLDARQPLDLGHAVPAGQDQAKRKALGRGQRLTVQREREKRLGVEGILHVHAAAVRGDDLAAAGLCFLLGLHVGAEEDHLARFGLEAAFLENRRQRNAAPHPVAEQPTHPRRPRRVARALERDRLLALVGPRPQLIEAVLARLVDETCDPQLECRRIDLRRRRLVKRVVLVVGRRPRRQLAEVVAANRRVRGLRIDLELGRVVGERDQLFIGLQRPEVFRNPQRRKPCGPGRAPRQHLATTYSFNHVLASHRRDYASAGRDGAQNGPFTLQCGQRMPATRSYGVPPPEYRLPDATHLGGIKLQVSDLDRSRSFYTEVLGLQILSDDNARISLGVPGHRTLADRAVHGSRCAAHPSQRPAGPLPLRGAGPRARKPSVTSWSISPGCTCRFRRRTTWSAKRSICGTPTVSASRSTPIASAPTGASTAASS